MTFLNRVGNLLKQNVCKRVSSGSYAKCPSLFQAISCMSSYAATELFVEGLAGNIDAISLKEAFSQYGSVIEARIIMDLESGKPRGFGFVTYDTIEAASIGQDFQGLIIRVNFATEKPCSGGGYGEGDGYGGGGGDYGGYGYGCGGNQGGGNYSGGDGNYGGDVSNGGGSQFSGVGGYGGYGDSVQDGGGGNYAGSKPIGGFSSLLKDTSGAIGETQVPLGGDQG